MSTRIPSEYKITCIHRLKSMLCSHLPTFPQVLAYSTKYLSHIVHVTEAFGSDTCALLMELSNILGHS